MNKTEYQLTRGQAVAWDILQELADRKRESIEWTAFVEEIRGSGATVKNWMTIRSILQIFLNEGLIERAPFDPSETGEFYYSA